MHINTKCKNYISKVHVLIEMQMHAYTCIYLYIKIKKHNHHLA